MGRIPLISSLWQERLRARKRGDREGWASPAPDKGRSQVLVVPPSSNGCIWTLEERPLWGTGGSSEGIDVIIGNQVRE